MESVGYDLYMALLNDAVRREKGLPEAEKTKAACVLDVKVSASSRRTTSKATKSASIFIKDPEIETAETRGFERRAFRPLRGYPGADGKPDRAFKNQKRRQAVFHHGKFQKDNTLFLYFEKEVIELFFKIVSGRRKRYGS
jgi:hypothetical protein